MNWDAANAIATFSAVVVALFAERFWVWWNKPRPILRIFDRVDVDRKSLIILSVVNKGLPIEDARLFWVGAHYISKTDSRPIYKKNVPIDFEWLINENSKKASQQRKIYGEELFRFLWSEHGSDGWHQPNLNLTLSGDDNPFNIFQKDPNFEITLYLQLKGSSFSSKYWPVRLTYDSGTAGGWVVFPEQPLSENEFQNLIPNQAENHFRQATKRLQR